RLSHLAPRAPSGLQRPTRAHLRRHGSHVPAPPARPAPDEHPPGTRDDRHRGPGLLRGVNRSPHAAALVSASRCDRGRPWARAFGTTGVMRTVPTLVGIDLGTTQSAVAYWHDGAAHLVPNELGDVLTPSAVAELAPHGALVVCRAAKVMIANDPAR